MPKRLPTGSTPPAGIEKMPDRFPDSSSGDRLTAAAVRACSAYQSLGRKADSVGYELDDITSPGNVRQPLSEEDSLVIAISKITG